MKITLTLIIVNIIVFMYQIYLGLDNQDLSYAFMANNALSPSGNIITLITNMFIHHDIMHIGMNMFGLYFLGKYIEGTIKENKFLALYFISGLTASIISFIYINTIMPHMVIGASGAIFGLWAYYSLYRKEFKDFLIIAGITNIAMIFGGLPIAWYAHLGGAIGGIGFWYYENRRKKLYKIWYNQKKVRKKW